MPSSSQCTCQEQVNSDLIKKALGDAKITELQFLPHTVVDVSAGDLLFIPSGMVIAEKGCGDEIATGIRKSFFTSVGPRLSDLQDAVQMFETSGSAFAAKLKQIVAILEISQRVAAEKAEEEEQKKKELERQEEEKQIEELAAREPAPAIIPEAAGSHDDDDDDDVVLQNAAS